MKSDKVDYFIEHTNGRFDRIETWLVSLSEKVDELRQFKWQIIGGSVAISAIVALAINIIMVIVTKG